MNRSLLAMTFVLILFMGSIPFSISDSLPSPKTQTMQGISPTDIICNVGKVLVFRISNDSPLCLRVENIIKMVNRGIIHPLSENPFGVDSMNISITKDSSPLIHLANEKEIQTYLDLSETKIEISSIIDDSSQSFGGRMIDEDFSVEQFGKFSAPSVESSPSPTVSGDYYTTNIQVKNVDEPDYVKNDGKHIFVANDYTLTIIDATPPVDAGIVEKFLVTQDFGAYTEDGIHDIFLNDDKLIIFLKQFDGLKTQIKIIDVSQRDSAKLVKQFTVTGNYQSARMIDEYVYLVTSNLSVHNNEIIIPNITYDDLMTSKENLKIFAFSSNTLPQYTYKTITSFDTSGNNVNSESYLMGEGNTIYVSQNSIYITYVDTATKQIIDFLDWEFIDVVFPYLEPSDQFKIRKLLLDNSKTILQQDEKWLKILDIVSKSLVHLDENKLERLRDDLGIQLTNNITQTVIQKIDINQGQFNLVSSAKVAGTVLNQFSMDEYDDQFRIATTSWDTRSGVSNNVNVFDIKNSALLLVGSLDKIALRESIYSARFVGDTLYLVTFRQVDPFFVIDLSNDQPKILGELKIPGFSNYLHPFGKDHVIGIGRDGGVKIAMFDVSDFENPKLAGQVFIGNNRNTVTEAEENHKSVLIDFNKQLLAIPITDHNNNSNFESNQSWYGFYVYKINEQGFTPKGTVEVKNKEHYNGRTIYIDNTIYSISPEMVSLNELDSLKLIQTIDIT